MKADGVGILCVDIGKSQSLNETKFIKQLTELVSKPDYLFQTVFAALDKMITADPLVAEICEAIRK